MFIHGRRQNVKRWKKNIGVRHFWEPDGRNSISWIIRNYFWNQVDNIKYLENMNVNKELG